MIKTDMTVSYFLEDRPYRKKIFIGIQILLLRQWQIR